MLGEQIQSLMFDYFVPSTGETVKSYINEFVGKAKGLSGVGFAMLIVTALLMMRTIDSSFNKIWRVKSDKSLVRTLLVYWAVLTLGPILLGSSLLLTSYLKSLPLVSDVVNDNSRLLTVWLPFFMAGIAFSVMYYVIPNRKIPFYHALIAGAITAIFFELAKFCFAVFVASFSTYQLIFGALAAVPLFLIWIYLSWGIVLLGAEICHGLSAFELEARSSREHPFIEIVKVILLLGEYQNSGKVLDFDNLQQFQDEHSQWINFNWIDKLANADIIVRTQDQSFCLLKSVDKIDYSSIFEVCGRTLPELSQIEDSELPDKTRHGLINFVKSQNETFATFLQV